MARMGLGRFEVASILSSIIWTTVATAVGALSDTLVDPGDALVAGRLRDRAGNHHRDFSCGLHLAEAARKAIGPATLVHQVKIAVDGANYSWCCRRLGWETGLAGCLFF
jgi:hypothetical protein